MDKGVRIFQYIGYGLNKLYKNSEWIVGIKNYTSESDFQTLNTFERHLETDELFVPISKGSVLAYEDKKGTAVEPMEIGKIYCVNQKTWHNVAMSKNSKLILIERPGTGEQNSEFKPMPVETIKYLRELRAN